MEQLTSSSSVQQEKPATEHRQAYGTAKTENLRDSGAWRILLPGFVAIACLALLAIPVIILALLLRNSSTFTWLWITMLVVDLGIAALIARGLIRIFMTQAGNYRD